MTHVRFQFPLLVVAMTLALGALIFFLFREEFSATLTNGNGQVDVVEYQAFAHGITKDVRTRLNEATSDEERVAALEKTQEALLAIVVPVGYQSVHLEMVIVLSLWAQGYEGDEAKRLQAESRWQTLVEEYPWIE